MLNKSSKSNTNSVTRLKRKCTKHRLLVFFQNNQGTRHKNKPYINQYGQTKDR